MAIRDRAVDHTRGFLRDLPDHGLPVPIPKQQDFLRAMALLPPRDVTHLYWIARTTLTTSTHDQEIFDPVFDLWFRGGPELSEVDARDTNEEQPAPDPANNLDEPPERAVADGSGLAASSSLLAKRTAFARTPNEERRTLEQLRKALPTTIPAVRSRRRGPGRRGDRLDVRMVHRAAWRSGGEVVSLRWRRRLRRQRPVLVLIDISGSMKQHSGDYLRFAHAVVGSCDRAEVFTFGTTLTRVTKALLTRDVDTALERLADIVRDADGGTRIGLSLQEFLGNTRHLRMARGALVLVLSDGLERGDCVPLTKAVRRLSLLGHRLVWWSPLACDPAYRPVTRGMAAVVGQLDALAGVRDLETAHNQLLKGARAWT